MFRKAFAIIGISFFIWASQLYSLNAGAEGGGMDTGGGSYTQDPKTGKLVLADLFVGEPTVGQPIRLAQRIKDEIFRLMTLFNRNVPQSGQDFRAYIFVPKYLTGPTVEYWYVDKLPCKDDPLPISGLPQVPFACTDKAKGITYLLKGEIERLSLEQAALGIIHERFHYFAPQAKHLDIASFVKGIHLLSTIHQEQAKDTTRIPFPYEYKAIADLAELSQKLGLHPVQGRTVIPQGGGGCFPLDLGGGVYLDCVLVSDDSTMVGVDSLVDSALVRGSTVINSELTYARREYQKDSVMGRSLGVSKSLIRNSKITHAGGYGLYLSNFTIKDSKLNFYYHEEYSPKNVYTTASLLLNKVEFINSDVGIVCITKNDGINALYCDGIQKKLENHRFTNCRLELNWQGEPHFAPGVLGISDIDNEHTCEVTDLPS